MTALQIGDIITGQLIPERDHDHIEGACSLCQKRETPEGDLGQVCSYCWQLIAPVLFCAHQVRVPVAA